MSFSNRSALGRVAEILSFPVGRDRDRAKDRNDPPLCQVFNPFSDTFVRLTQPDDNVGRDPVLPEYLHRIT